MNTIEPSTLTLITTHKCAASCKSCCFCCSPKRTESMSVNDGSLSLIIDEMTDSIEGLTTQKANQVKSILLSELNNEN